ncbi:MAG: trypsin-like peptidase domain-containing protein [Pyrinomonadaceae bacterium]|nr:trypsin-like peptidase domain-containing protein [Pyrinomonadaceae bacterium]
MAEISRSLSESTARHAVALFFGSFMDLVNKGSADYIKAQGTLTLISYRGLCFGVTNERVVQDYERPTKDKLFHIALKRHTRLPGRLLFKSKQDNVDFPFDLAVFVLHEATIRNGGKVPIQLDVMYEPINPDDQALAIGFPGAEREKRDEQMMSHRLYHVVANCVGASDRKIVLYEKLSSPETKPHRFGGMSGGPIFRLKTAESVAFSGILFEGRGFGDADSEQIGDEIWVYGFPLGPKGLERAFNVFNPKLEL